MVAPAFDGQESFLALMQRYFFMATLMVALVSAVVSGGVQKRSVCFFYRPCGESSEGGRHQLVEELYYRAVMVQYY